MVTLCCLVVVDGSIVAIPIDERQLVGELKNAIKAAKSNGIECDADELTLYLAKRGGSTAGGWLSSVQKEDKAAIAALSSPEIPKEFRETYLKDDLKMDPTFDIGAYFDTQKPGPKEIHVLVVVPPPSETEPMDPASHRLELILPNVLANAATTTSDLTRDFKANVGEFYGYFHRQRRWIRCMLLDQAFPEAVVIASHLFRRSTQYLALEMMQIPNIDLGKNGLLLFKPLAHALDHFQISFIRDASDVFRLKLFDPSIASTRLIDLKNRNGERVLTADQLQLLTDSVSLAEEPCTFDLDTTFGDLDGSALTFTGIERP